MAHSYILSYFGVDLPSRGVLVPLSRSQETRLQDSLIAQDERSLSKHGDPQPNHGFRAWIEIKLDNEFGPSVDY